MEIKKDTLLKINHSRKGQFYGIAIRDFNTEEEWYPVRVAELKEGGNGKSAYGLNERWIPGQEIPCRNGLCKIEVA